MFFERGKIKQAQKKANERYKDLGVRLDPIEVNNFKAIVNSLASVKTYKEGEKIRPEDLEMIGENVNSLLLNMTATVSGMIKNKKLKVSDPVDYLMTATDCLYLLAMDRLGCPDIIVGFSDSVKKTIADSAIAIHRVSVSFDDITKESAFTAQRGKDAAVLWAGEIGNTIRNIENAAPGSVGKLHAEYQALVQRQEGHGRIWRFFHKAENEARIALMEKMKEALNKKLEKKYDLDKSTPKSIARAVAEVNVEKNVSISVYERFSNPQKFFGVNEGVVDVSAQLDNDEDLNIIFDNSPKSPKVSDPAPEKSSSPAPEEKNEFCIL